MFIYNLKLNKTKLFKVILIIFITFVIVLCGIVAYRLYKASFKVDDSISNSNIIKPNEKNYANILKAVHDNLDDYVGQRIKYSGFVYRVYDLELDQFVLARNMIISSDNQTVVVGFLCQSDDAGKFIDRTWVEIEGIITKGSYHGDMPIIKVISITEISKPDIENVYPPNSDYIPTSVIL